MLTEEDLNYSEERPELAELGAIDGKMASGLPQQSDDALTRRDLGIEFLDVASKLDISTESSTEDGVQTDVLTIENTSDEIVDTHLLLLASDLTEGVTLMDTEEVTVDGVPFLRTFLEEGVLEPGASFEATLRFELGDDADEAEYELGTLSGQGTPETADGSSAP